MEELYIKEKLNTLRNEMNHLWGGAFILGGGSFTLMLNQKPSIAINIWIIAGWILTLALVNAYFSCRVINQKILEQIKENKK